MADRHLHLVKGTGRNGRRQRCPGCGRWPMVTDRNTLHRHRTEAGGPWCSMSGQHPQQLALR